MCVIEGCDKPSRRGPETMCEMHYMRMYRHGSLDKKLKAKEFEHSGGYILAPANGHPLSRGDSHHYKHRMGYYDAHGEGPFCCKWCGCEVTWSTLHIDHLDDNPKNNDISNLAASCARCNQKRGQHKIRDSWRKKVGITAHGKTLTLNEWADELGISRTSIVWRLKNGWSLDKALSQGRGITGPKKS